MAGGVLGAAGFLQPCQGERQALREDGVQDGEEGSGALPPASAQADKAVGVERSEAT